MPRERLPVAECFMGDARLAVPFCIENLSKSGTSGDLW